MKVASRSPESVEQRIGPRLLWFSVFGGATAWALHVVVAWSFLELGCLRTPLGTGVQLVAVLATAVPWLVALVGTVTSLQLRSRRHQVQVDELARERLDLLTHVAVFLNILSLAAITGGGVALLVLETCS